MTVQPVLVPTDPSTTHPSSERAATPAHDLLLAAGVVAGPLFCGVAGVQAATREGFDLTVLPLSALSLGGLGWVQIANFVTYGLLMLAFAVGVRRRLRGTRGGTSGPVLLGGYGLGLVTAGAFVTDPALGFPHGAPTGVPETFSWHAQVHGLAASIAFGCAMLASLVLAAHFRAAARPGWAAYSVVTAVAAIACSPLVPGASVSLRLTAGTLLLSAWTCLLALHFRRAARR